MFYRQKSLEWWYKLTEDERELLIEKHFPTTVQVGGHYLISTSSSKIEEIYCKEFNLEYK